MRSVAFVARLRLRRRWQAVVVAGLLLGVGFGLCFASLAAAGRTDSAYDRILGAADAPDAAIAHGPDLSPAQADLSGVKGVTEQRYYAGVLGFAKGIDRELTRALLVPRGEVFPLERPAMRAGRLPDPDALNEIFVNDTFADAAGLRVGQHLDFTLFTNDFSGTVEARVTIVGIGTLPSEIVTDETSQLSVTVFTPAFYAAHRDLMVYSASSVFLADGFDARRDLAPAASALGFGLQSARTQERQAVGEALRPLIIVLLAVGILAFVATAIGAGQIIQRDRDRWRADNLALASLGMVRSQLVLVQMMTSAVIATVAIATALVAMLLVSPLAPIGPLHDFDPAQGFAVDVGVAALGIAVMLLTIVLLTIGLTVRRTHAFPPTSTPTPWVATGARRPATIAGLTLAFRRNSQRWPLWRSLAASTSAMALLALVATLVAAAAALTTTPSRYGYDFDLLVVNQFGNQSKDVLETTFKDDGDVVAATGFTTGTFLLDGRAVPGMAAMPIKGDLGPTILEGAPVRNDREIVVGRDTLDLLGAEIGDVVRVRISRSSAPDGATPTTAVPMTIVGIATFPSVNQAGVDVARLGTGALVTRRAFEQMGGDPRNDPEFTAVRLRNGVDPAVVIARNPDGIPDPAPSSTTTWFTDAKPAELRQLDLAMPLLRGALFVGYFVVLAVFAHALWSRVRTARRELGVLRALGCTRRQLDEVAAWQAAPLALMAILIGIPAGFVIGRVAFMEFARSLAVVDDASISFFAIAALVVAALTASMIAAIGAVIVARQTNVIVALREP